MCGCCQDCKIEAQTKLYHSELILNTTNISKSEGLGLKVELCSECYEKRVISEQIEYWKVHILEEKNRSMR
ncbi:MAG: hypothetical protein CMA21_00985 [Euryarchaeota archaeon]|nr:hypothetical protein [Euryarchaeota archaeon]